MGTLIRLRDEQLDYLVETVSERFNRETIEKGYNLYLGRAVSEEGEMTGTSVFQVLVRDKTGNCRVGLDCDFFDVSECTCGNAEYCEHMVAAFLKLYAMNGKRPELFVKQYVENWMAKPAQKPKAAPRSFMQDLNTPKTVKERAKRRQAETKLARLTETSTVDEWHAYFAQMWELHRERLLSEFYKTFPQLQQEMEQCAAQWPRALAELYRIHMLIDIGCRIEEMYKKAGTSVYHYYLVNLINGATGEIREKLIEAVAKANREAIIDRYEARLEETAKRLHEQLCSGGQSAMGWLLLYRYVWWNLLRSTALRDKERARLQRTLKQMPERHDQIMLGLMHLHFMEGREEEALSMFQEQLHDPVPEYAIIYLQYYLQKKETDKLRHWLMTLLPYLRGADQDLIEHCLEHYWEGLAKLTGNRDEPLEAMSRLLPASYELYSDKLMKLGHYKLWIDLQMAMSFDPMELEEKDLRKIGAKHPDLLLPLYHQTIERCIAYKNRESYQTAVHYMAKLRDCYYKLRAAERWNEYIGYIREQHSRLRAFQEELKKGKLIS